MIFLNFQDPDKRKLLFLLINDPNDNSEEETDYYEPQNFECVDKFPKNYQLYKETKICVKDFKKYASECDSEESPTTVENSNEVETSEEPTTTVESTNEVETSEDSSTIVWAIIISIVGIVIAAGIAFAFHKIKILDKSRKESRPLQASDVEPTEQVTT